MDELNHSQENPAEACRRLRLEMQIDRFDQFVTLNDSSSVQLFLYPTRIKRVVFAVAKGKLDKNTTKLVTIRYSGDSR